MMVGDVEAIVNLSDGAPSSGATLGGVAGFEKHVWCRGVAREVGVHDTGTP